MGSPLPEKVDSVSAADKSSASPLIASLHDSLLDLYNNPTPHVPNPPDCKKRASVALIIRVRPTYEHALQRTQNSAAQTSSPSSSSSSSESISVPTTLSSFFSNSWVQSGDPEVLFIKRASRVGDRWTGHVALPGGKRDPDDDDDRAAAVREAREEIGLDLEDPRCVLVGQLPERVVTTSWGRQVLMVLCPYLFLFTSQEIPAVALQPTEVASTHWVSLRALLSPSLRTVEHVDVSERLARQGGNLVRPILRSMMGKMMFSAVTLIPSENVMCNSIPGFIPEEKYTSSSVGLYQSLKSYIFPSPKNNLSNPPLLLWGLTLGIVSDLLETLPPNNAVELWQYPTFTTPDLRFITYLLTYNLRKRNYEALKKGGALNQTAVDGTTAALAVPPEDRTNDVGIGGLGIGKAGSKHAVGVMLEGYYDKVRVAVAVFVALRLAVGGAGIFALARWLRSRK